MMTFLARLACAALAGATLALGQAVPFHVEELLAHPRADGVGLTVVPEIAAEVFVEYGVNRRDVRRTVTRAVEPATPVRFDLRALPSDAEVFYRVVARPLAGKWTPRAVQSFRTLRSPGETVTFGIAADSHAYAVWTRFTCKQPPDVPAYARLTTTLDRMASDEALDFVVVGGDDVMTHCNSGCKACDVDGVYAGAMTAATQQEVQLRYRQTWSTDLLGRLGKRRPLLYMLGNHDGEAGYGQNFCDSHSNQLRGWSEQERLAYFPNAADSYGGSEKGHFFSVVSGDARLIFLDVMRFTPTLPSNASGWTLGDEQLGWLTNEVLATPETFKFVFLEHLVGGTTEPFSCGHYGRGSLRSTETGKPEAPFEGEQALVHALLRRGGVQAVFLFHDHVAAYGEKPGLDGVGEGVVYATCGQVGSNVPPWSDEGWYRKAMDFDDDGIAEYMTDVTGTRKRGYYRVSVGERATVEYVGTDLEDPTKDGAVVFSFTLDP